MRLGGTTGKLTAGGTSIAVEIEDTHTTGENTQAHIKVTQALRFKKLVIVVDITVRVLRLWVIHCHRHRAGTPKPTQQRRITKTPTRPMQQQREKWAPMPAVRPARAVFSIQGRMYASATLVCVVAVLVTAHDQTRQAQAHAGDLRARMNVD